MVCQTSRSETNSGTLYYHSEQLDATSADNKCVSSDQGRLAILDTEEKFRDAIELAPQKRCWKTYYIIGLNKNGSDFLWLNGVRNKLAFDNQPYEEGQCGWISPIDNNYEYKTPGKVFTGKCDRPMTFLCFKPSFINNATSSSTTFFTSTVKKFSEEMSFSENPYSTYSTSSRSAMGLPDSTERTSANGLLVGGIAAVAVFTLVIAGILACMKYRKGQFASRSTKIEIENSLYGKIEGHRTHDMRIFFQKELFFSKRNDLYSVPALPLCAPSGCLGCWVKGSAKNTIVWLRSDERTRKKGMNMMKVNETHDHEVYKKIKVPCYTISGLLQKG